MNKFGDLTNKEFVNRMSGVDIGLPTSQISVFNYSNNTISNDAIDWRTLGYVTPVKNQGHCGSCWAFSAVGNLEGQYFNRTGKLISLSEKDLLDCSTNGNNGCQGGLMVNAFHFVYNYGIMSSVDYPYLPKQGNCIHDFLKVVTKLKIIYGVKSGDESALQMATSQYGPISVAINAGSRTFQFYSRGVYYDPNCGGTKNDLNHGVLLAGYASDYYIVKNSWGTDWGDAGYIHMSKNRNNNCGIATMANFVLI